MNAKRHPLDVVVISSSTSCSSNAVELNERVEIHRR